MGTFAKKNDSFIPAGSTRSLNAGIDAGRCVKLDTLTGSVVTLPKATGSGCKFLMVETLAATSNSHIIKVRDNVDIMIGQVTVSGASSVQFVPGASDDTITLNRTTTGGAVRGAWFEFEDVAPGIWAVTGCANGSGAVATPFSATV